MPEMIAGRELRLSNLDKVLYPATGTTKGAVIEYYLAIAPVLLPLAEGRPVTRKRWVNGVGTAENPGQVFFRKDLEEGAPTWIPRQRYRHKTTTNTYPLAEEPAVLAWFAQLAALELHVPQWRFDDDGARCNPDRLVLDLDPGQGAGLTECVRVALACKELLDDMGLASVPVTSGSKGIHLYARLDGAITSDDASAIAKRLAGAIAEEHPDLATANMRKDLRRGKVLIDWSQNSAAKTTVCPYSLRGRPRPTVAAPRTWEEIRQPGLRQLTFRQVLKRVEEGLEPLRGFARRAGREQRSSGTEGEPAPEGEDGEPLARYRAKRDAARTPEPFPAPGAPGNQDPIFVIQRHAARRLHWDFRLEHDGVLASWAVPKGPPLDPRENRLAVHTEDHPLEYATFEGEIPKGEYGGGQVEIWDRGTIEIEKWRQGREVIAVLHPESGGGLGGVPRRYALIHTGRGTDRSTQNWLIHLMKEQPPAPARPAATEPPAEAVPEIPAPMLATRATGPFLARIRARQEAWALEMKWDGIRAVVGVGAQGVRVMSRGGNDITEAYPEVAELAGLTSPGTVVDGEIVALGPTGAPDFGRLQHRMHLAGPERVAAEAARTPVHFVVFDLLAHAGQNLLGETYERRRALLFAHVRTGGKVLVPAAEPEDLATAMAVSRDLGLEGVVAKRRRSAYSAGARSEDWVKVKHEKHQEVIVVGWRPNERGGMASLILGVPGTGGLRYAGRVGTGFLERERTRIPADLAAIERPDPPLPGVPRETARDARWVQPVRIGEVRYSEETRHGTLRHPVWRGWRPDKAPADVRREGGTDE